MTRNSQQNSLKWKAYHARLYSEYLEARRHFVQPTPEILKIFADGKAYILSQIATALRKSSADHPDLPVIYATIHELKRLTPSIRNPGPGKGRPPEISLPLEEVPVVDIERIQRSPQKSRQRHLIYTYREILGAARRAGLPEELNYDSLRAFRAELDERGLAAISRKTKIRECRELAGIWGLDHATIALLVNEHRAARLEADQEPSALHASFRAAPLSPLDYAKIASKVSEEAFQCNGSRQSVQRLFLTAAALALLSFLPERISDIIRLTIGRDVTRHAHGWSSSYFANKIDDDRSVDYLPEQLTPYLDDLVLLGASPGPHGENLVSLYKHRANTQSPLFAHTDLVRGYSDTRIFEWTKKYTGHGPHAARKAMTDYLVEIGGARSEIMVLLGHRRESTSIKHYEVRAGAIRRQRTTEALDRHRADLMSRGEIRLPNGRLIDLKRISRDLDRA